MIQDILSISQVSCSYFSNSLGLFSERKKIPVLKDISLSIKRNEFFGLVGESGSGKSTLAKCVLGLLPHTGSILVDGMSYSKENCLAYYSGVQAVFQDPLSALDPRRTVGSTMAEPLLVHGQRSKAERERAVDEMLENVGLDSSYKKRLPAELSGGQRQRVCIGASLMLKPKLLVADEAISSLDVSVGAQILNLFQDLHRQMEFALLFISHNLDVVYYLCSKIAVMYKGEIVESGTAEDVYGNPQNPYTKQLLSSQTYQRPDSF